MPDNRTKENLKILERDRPDWAHPSGLQCVPWPERTPTRGRWSGLWLMPLGRTARHNALTAMQQANQFWMCLCQFAGPGHDLIENCK